MGKRGASVPLWLGLVTGLLVGGSTAAGPVYRWTDEKGEVHFSDRPPDTGARSAEEVEVAPPPQGGAGDDYYSVVNQARRLEEQRLERERRQAEIELLQRQAAPPAPPPREERRDPDPGGTSHAIWVAPPAYWGPGTSPGYRPPYGPGGPYPYPPAYPRPGHRPPPGRLPQESEPPSFKFDTQRR